MNNPAENITASQKAGSGALPQENQDNAPAEILSVREYLSRGNLCIPDYQRPYKWNILHVRQLIEDIRHFSSKASYRIGTIVLRQDTCEDVLEIVDGQQRTITLMLIMHALYRSERHREACKTLQGKLCADMADFEFSNPVSQQNIIENFAEIRRLINQPDFSDAVVKFLLEQCELVVFTLHDISEAFQFFDAQNARGKDLAPHDLLKAYHLRETSEAEAPLLPGTVRDWEACRQQALEDLFANYLYRIRNWSRGKPARGFRKTDAGLFKGIRLDEPAYPYQQPLRFVQAYVDRHDRDYGPRAGLPALDFPFQLDQHIINGRNFFAMTAYYHQRVQYFTSANSADDGPSLARRLGCKEDSTGWKILQTLHTYEGRSRTGDLYVRNLFDCLILYYLDKFGHDQIDQAICKCFIWAFSLRLTNSSVHRASADNYVLENNLFRVLRDATAPEEFLAYALPVIEKTSSSKTEEIKELFKGMNYHA